MTWLNPVDKQYHTILEELLKAPIRGDRTGTGTRSIFGRQLRFSNLETQFPLITTKKVWFKGIFHELKWMLMGDTNIKYLVDNGVSIWTDWPLKKYNAENHDFPLTKEDFENKIRTNGRDWGSNELFADKWGDCGPVYGYQWRKWPGPLEMKINNGPNKQWEVVTTDDINECVFDHTLIRRQPIDQIASIIHDLKTTPESRRMIVSAWNVADIPEMIPSGLPPCHYTFQFYTRPLSMKERLNRSELYDVNEQWIYDSSISGKNKYKLDEEGIPERYLDCMMSIRSWDFMLGAPFNIAQYALLTHMLAKTVNMVPGELIINGGDVHLYVNHEEQAREQLSRYSAAESPKLFINNRYDDPKNYEWSDIRLDDYISHDTIKAPIAV